MMLIGLMLVIGFFVGLGVGVYLWFLDSIATDKATPKRYYPD